MLEKDIGQLANSAIAPPAGFYPLVEMSSNFRVEIDQFAIHQEYQLHSALLETGV